MLIIGKDGKVVNFDNVLVVSFRDTECKSIIAEVKGGVIELGTYNTKKRAREVYDELVQKIIKNIPYQMPNK